MVVMIAMKDFHYAKRDLAVNDEFEARERDVKLLTVTRRARVRTASEVGRYQTVTVPESPETRVMDAARREAARTRVTKKRETATE